MKVTLSGRGTHTHPQFGDVKYSVRDLGDEPGEQVRRTLELMRERVAEDADSPEMRDWVYSQFDVPMYGGQKRAAENVWAHTKNAIKFQRDEKTGGGVGGFGEDEVVETIIRPVDMKRFVESGVAVGDCDDFSMYEACVLKVLGIPCEFVTVAADGRVPDQFSHVYVVAYPDGQRIALDASHGEYAGWEVGNEFGKYQAWPVMDHLGLWVGKAVMQGALILGMWFGLKKLWRRSEA